MVTLRNDSDDKDKAGTTTAGTPEQTKVSRQRSSPKRSLSQSGRNSRQFGTLDATQLQLVQSVVNPDSLLINGISNYTFIKELGAGKFSRVYLARHIDTGKLYAIKHTPLHPHHPQIAARLLREPTLIASLPPHPNLIRIHELIQTEDNCYLAQDYLVGCTTLEDHVKSLPREIVSYEVADRILSQLVSVVRWMHKFKICHRDIKPENIMIHPQTMHLTLLDFGLSTRFSASSAKLATVCGSPAYHSPELVLALAHPKEFIPYLGPEVDIWCIGITMLRCLAGYRFPIGPKHNSVSGMMARLDRIFGLEQMLTCPLRKVLTGLMELKTEDRLTYFQSIKVEEPMNSEEAASNRVKTIRFIPGDMTYTIPLEYYTRTSIQDGGMRMIFNLTIPEKDAMVDIGMRVVSFVKYALRCAGLLYHVQESRMDIKDGMQKLRLGEEISEPSKLYARRQDGQSKLTIDINDGESPLDQLAININDGKSPLSLLASLDCVVIVPTAALSRAYLTLRRRGERSCIQFRLDISLGQRTGSAVELFLDTWATKDSLHYQEPGSFIVETLIRALVPGIKNVDMMPPKSSPDKSWKWSMFGLSRRMTNDIQSAPTSPSIGGTMRLSESATEMERPKSSRPRLATKQTMPTGTEPGETSASTSTSTSTETPTSPRAAWTLFDQAYRTSLYPSGQVG